MQRTSPRSSSRELIVAKLEALLDECDLVADHAPLAETFDILAYLSLVWSFVFP